jgi:hypothetical protein
LKEEKIPPSEKGYKKKIQIQEEKSSEEEIMTERTRRSWISI